MRDFLQEFLCCRLLIAPFGGANLPGRSITAPERGFRPLNGRAAALVNGDEAIRLRRQPAALEAAVKLRLVLPNPFDVMHGGSFRQSPLAPGLLGPARFSCNDLSSFRRLGGCAWRVPCPVGCGLFFPP